MELLCIRFHQKNAKHPPVCIIRLHYKKYKYGNMMISEAVRPSILLIVRPCILIVVYVFFLLFVHVFLLLTMYSYCSAMYSYRCLCILIVVHVFLLLSMYSYCSSMYSSYCSSMYSYRCLCILIVVHVFLDTATLTEVFPCFFLGCKANARV